MKHVLAVLQHHCCMFASPWVCFLQHCLHHLIYILQDDIKIVHHHSKEHRKITEGNVGLHIVRITQKHNAAALVFNIWHFSLTGTELLYILDISSPTLCYILISRFWTAYLMFAMVWKT